MYIEPFTFSFQLLHKYFLPFLKFEYCNSCSEKARSSEFVFEHVSLSKALKIMQFLDDHNIYIKKKQKG